jgi:hypothetical protein
MESPWLIYLLVCVLGAYPALILATIVHEIGHAIFARLAGYRVTSLGLGVGSPLMILQLPGNVLFYICRNNPLFGTCWTTTTETLTSFPRYTLRLMGGVIANLLVMALLISTRSLPFGWIGVALGLFNGFLAAINLLPFRARLNPQGSPISSDGMKVISAYFSQRHFHADDPVQEL